MNKEITNTNYCEETRKLKGALETGFIKLGERLKKIRDERLYEGRWNNFEEFVADMQMSEATASRLITVYSKFILEYGMDSDEIGSIGWSTLYVLAKSVDNKKEAKEFVEKALVCKRSDLEEELREKKAKANSRECEHDYFEVHFKQCKKCGVRVKIYNK